MVDQASRIKSKAQILQSKPPRLCLKTLMVGLCVFALSICSVLTATCPPSVPSSATITTEQCNFSGYSGTQAFRVAVGPVSNSLYYSYQLNTPSASATIRRVNASGSQTWMASLAFDPVVKSLSVDAAEQCVYLARNSNPSLVVRFSTSDGSLVSQHQL